MLVTPALQSSHLKIVNQGPVVVASHVISVIYQLLHLQFTDNLIICCSLDVL